MSGKFEWCSNCTRRLLRSSSSRSHLPRSLHMSSGLRRLRESLNAIVARTASRARLIRLRNDRSRPSFLCKHCSVACNSSLASAPPSIRSGHRSRFSNSAIVSVSTRTLTTTSFAALICLVQNRSTLMQLTSLPTYSLLICPLSIEVWRDVAWDVHCQRLVYSLGTPGICYVLKPAARDAADSLRS